MPTLGHALGGPEKMGQHPRVNHRHEIGLAWHAHSRGWIEQQKRPPAQAAQGRHVLEVDQLATSAQRQRAGVIDRWPGRHGNRHGAHEARHITRMAS